MADLSNDEVATTQIPNFDTMSVEQLEEFDLDAFLLGTSNNNKEQDEEHIIEQTETTIDDDNSIDSVQQQDDTNTQVVDDDNDAENNSDEDINQKAIAFYKSIIGTPIRANKHDIVFEDENQVIQLLQMGANYTKKMQDLKPYQGAIKALKDAEILGDADKLNQLIDIAKGDKNAILAFAKANSIDLSQYDEDEDIDYKPTNKIKSNEELDLAETFDNLRTKGLFDDVSKAINTTFTDDVSKNSLASNPKLITSIAEDIDSGIYDKLMPSVNMEILLHPDKPALDIYIEKYTLLAKQYEEANGTQKVDVPQQVVENNKKDLANAISKTPSKTTQKKSSKKVDISTVDFFSMSEEEADKFYKEHLAGLIT